MSLYFDFSQYINLIKQLEQFILPDFLICDDILNKLLLFFGQIQCNLEMNKKRVNRERWLVQHYGDDREEEEGTCLARSSR